MRTERNPRVENQLATRPAVNKTPLTLAIVGIAVGCVPVLGSVVGLVFCVIALVLGKRAMEVANARPDRAGIVVAIVGKWLGFGGIIQNAVMTLYWPFWLWLVIEDLSRRG